MAAQVGETYAFKIFGSGFGACQVVAEKTVSRNLRELLLLRLDIVSDALPTADAIRASRPAQWLWSIDDFAPWWTTRIDGAELVLAEHERNSALGQWENLRLDALLARRSARAPAPLWRRDADSVIVDLGGKPASFHPNYASVDLRPLLPATNKQPNWDALHALPNLRSLTYAGPDRELIASLGALPSLLRLTWHAPAERVLDLRGTQLTELCVFDIAGPLTVFLPATCARFTAGGRYDLLSIRAPDVSEGFSLHLWGASAEGLPDGVQGLEEAAFYQPRRFDAALLRNWPRLKSLAIHGAYDLRNIQALRELKSLRRFAGSDLYGFDAVDFPSAAGPLYDVQIDGLRVDDAKILRKRLAGLPRARFTKTRSDKWLAENRDNPFRDWDADGAAFGKAAMKLWNEALRARHAFGDSPTVEQTKAIVAGIVAGLNKLDRRQSIDTLRREQACDAIVSLVRDHLGGSLDAEATQAAIDETRDW